MAGWVGDLPGMTWDATKNRYFKTPPASAPSAGPSARRNASQLASSIQADSVKQARVSNRAKANGGRGPHKDRVVSGIALKSSRVKADASRTGAYQAGTARLPRSQSWRLGDTGAHKSFLRSGRFLGLEQSPIIGDATLSSPATVLASLPGSSTHIMTGNEAGETFGIVDQRYEASEAELVFGSVIRDGHTSLGVRPRIGSAVRRYQWKTFNLSGSISGICCERDYFLALSFGPRPALVLCPEYPPFFSNERRYNELSTRPTFFHNLPQLRDAWCMDSRYEAISIGGHGKIAYSSHLNRPDGKFRTISIEGKSDVLAVKQINKNEAYIGLRSGAIHHHDFRTQSAGTMISEAGSDVKPVINLVGLENSFGCGRGLVVGRMANEISLFDLRFTRSGPAVHYDGHVNHIYRQRLGMAVDPSETTIFAAGTDGRVRGWDLYSGEPIRTQAAGPNSILGKTFGQPVAGLLCQDDGSIYATSGSELSLFGAASRRDSL